MRLLYLLFLAFVLAACMPNRAVVSPKTASTQSDEAFLNDVQRRTFNWFWETTNAKNGLVPDRYPTKSFSSVAAVGFGLTAYPVGVERGWITRNQAIERTLTTLKFFWNAPQGTNAIGQTGFKGFFYHFLDMETGARFRNTELSTIDTALFMAGALFSQSYFDRDTPNEKAIRAYADSLYRRVEWNWAQVREDRISMGWNPDTGMLPYDYWGYNEAMILYTMAMGSPTFPVNQNAWKAYTSSYQWGEFQGQSHLNFTPLFGHQYSHTWIDFRQIQDTFMREKGIDYFENSRRATLSQRSYAIENPDGWKDYSADIWGLTACDGPVNRELEYNGKKHQFHTYTARGASMKRIEDDGTLSPTAVGGSVPFAPTETIAALRSMATKYGEDLYAKYGFLDSFNPSFTFKDIKVQHGKVVDGKGWFDTDYLGIDQGPILLMIENHRTELIWKYMRKNPYIANGLKQAGFQGGWLDKAQTSAVSTTFRPTSMPEATALPSGKRIVILGSSTAEGVGPQHWENTWANRLRTYIQAQKLDIHIFNLARGGYNTFQILPDGSKLPNRPEPDQVRNITQALKLKPHAIIINMPSNDTTSGFSVQEQIQNFQIIANLAKNAGVEVWIATTQPRNLDDAKRAELIQLRDWIKTTYGTKALDFWTDLADENGRVRAQYDSGDHIHLNDEAHLILFERVKKSGIFEFLTKSER